METAASMKNEGAVFLDRDGVLVEDVHLLADAEKLRILEGVPDALLKIKSRGYALVLVTNQAIVARGMLTEKEVVALHGVLQGKLRKLGAPALDAQYFCPHHPDATLARYRVECECRKPRPGMLLRAAHDLSLNLSASFMVGDRISDIAAGKRAGCRTILVRSGKHLEAPIETPDAIDAAVEADYSCSSLREAADWIESNT